MANWRDSLRPGSFRGVPFEADGADRQGGRRIVLHEYPQRDEPYAEDLGRAPRKYTIGAWVIGADYMSQRDALVSALEKPGPGTLVHPWIGALTVQIETFACAETKDEGGMARLQIVCVEAGSLSYPSASVSTAAMVASRSGGVLAAAGGAFAALWSVASMPQAVLDTAIGLVADVAAAVGAVAGLAANAVRLAEEVRTTAPLLVHDAPALASALASLLVDSATATATATATGTASLTATDAAARIRALLQAGTTATTTAAAAAPGTPRGVVGQQQADNATAVAALLRQQGLAEAAATAAVATWESYDEAVAVLQPLAAAIDAETVAAVDDASYIALADLHTAVAEDISRRALRLPRLVTVTPAAPVSALILAYDLYEDIGRDAEIASRNGALHPGFLPASPLRVLSA